MPRVLAALFVLALGVSCVESALGDPLLDRGPRRTTVLVRPDWPLQRPQRSVVVSHTAVAVRVTPIRYLAPVHFAGLAVTAPASAGRGGLIWEGAANLQRGDDWTESTLSCDTRGTGLWMQVREGSVQFDWAEVVFANGDSQVVDFSERSYRDGLYALLDFHDGRRVDHVRLVARASSPEARVVLKMQK
ncbi:MAG TPA: hypothetical protein VMJ70_04515 [Candidatus Sulfotelmatobacter sp.]|nr:hypothetical protein [Candidatus Sulfotelmatobacter sp.]